MRPQAFEAARIRAALVPFAIDQPRPFTPDELCYLQFYGIDFARTIDGVEHYFGALDNHPHTLAIHLWRPRQPVGTFFVLHGYFDHVGIYQHLIRFLIEQGFAVVAFDLPGHGLSSGDPAYIDSFDEYVAAFDRCLCALNPQLDHPWHIVAQSTGAAIAMEWTLANGFTQASAPYGALVLLAPLVRPANWSTVRIAYHLGRHFITRRPRLFRENSEDAEFLRFLQELDPLQARWIPIAWITAMVTWMRRFQRRDATNIAPLVIQGQCDTSVDWQYNLKVIAQKFRPDIVYVPGARHHLVNELAPVRASVFAAIEAHLQGIAVN
jgi:alpha-beta hydrolase superfamily lysophospholipase